MNKKTKAKRTKKVVDTNRYRVVFYEKNIEEYDSLVEAKDRIKELKESCPQTESSIESSSEPKWTPVK